LSLRLFTACQIEGSKSSEIMCSDFSHPIQGGNGRGSNHAPAQIGLQMSGNPSGNRPRNRPRNPLRLHANIYAFKLERPFQIGVAGNRPDY
jgi:hypothetical protein